MAFSQQKIDRENSEYWDELCGTNEAKRLGITDSGQDSLAKFDSWYLGFYPYLLPTVQPGRMKGKKVLEIGLGYGTLGQEIARAGAVYMGMDIAQKPVDHMNYRLRLHGLHGRALQGSALAIPFPNGAFDFLVSIGCLHHTGNVQQCIDEVYRVLKPGGSAILMLYNKYSYMRWRLAPIATFLESIRGIFRPARPVTLAAARHRAKYDIDSNGKAAPEVALLSVGELQELLHSFASVSCSLRNANQLALKGHVLIPRPWLLSTLGRWLGLDIYVEARKGLICTQKAAA